MNAVSLAQPDVTLVLDLSGIIREATFSRALADEGVHAWLGKPWDETIIEGGSDRVRGIVDDARNNGMSAFRQVTQRFPSGRELPMEYTTVLLGGRAGLLAVGKSLQAVAELQTRLISAQQAMERDYWKLREVETKYRLLFDASHEPVVLLNSTSLRIIEANHAALAVLNLTNAPAQGRSFADEIRPADRPLLQDMLTRVRAQGKAPAIAVQFAREARPWLVRGSLMAAEPAPALLLQFSPAWTGHAAPDPTEAVPLDDLIERLPDAFVVLNRDGVIQQANQAFLDLVETGARGSVIGERLARWLSRAGADMAVLMANVARYGSIRLFTTTIQGELGSVTPIEISAVGGDGDRTIALMIREVGRRLGSASETIGLGAELTGINERIGQTPLRTLVKQTVGVVERHYVAEALRLAHDNRTVAAELLGLSRQSLYAKLRRYDMMSDTDGDDLDS